MNDIKIDDFQNSVTESLIRNKSVIDILTKLSESNSRIERAVAKSVTSCGCISIDAHKQRIPDDTALEDVHKLLKNQINGHMCDNCLEVLEKEIGNHFYYLTALCDAFDIKMSDIMENEYDKITTLGKFSFH